MLIIPCFNIKCLMLIKIVLNLKISNKGTVKGSEDFIFNRRSCLVLHDLYSVLISAPTQLSYPILPTLASAEIACDNDSVNPLLQAAEHPHKVIYGWGCGSEPHSKCWHFCLRLAATFSAVLCNHSVLIWEQVLIEGIPLAPPWTSWQRAAACFFLSRTERVLNCDMLV